MDAVTAGREDADRGLTQSKKSLTRRQRIGRDKGVSSLKSSLSERVLATGSIDDEPTRDKATFHASLTDEDIITSMLGRKVRPHRHYRKLLKIAKAKGRFRAMTLRRRQLALVESGRVTAGTGYKDLIGWPEHKKVGLLAGAHDAILDRAVIARMLLETARPCEFYRKQAVAAKRDGAVIEAFMAERKARLVDDGRVVVGSHAKQGSHTEGGVESRPTPTRNDQKTSQVLREVQSSANNEVQSRNFHDVVQGLKTRITTNISKMFGTVASDSSTGKGEIDRKNIEQNEIELSSAVGAGLLSNKESSRIQSRLDRPDIQSASRLAMATSSGPVFENASNVTARREQELNAAVQKRLNMPNLESRNWKSSKVQEQVQPRAELIEAMSPVQKVRESRSRPKWGGVEDGRLAFLVTSKQPEKDLPVEFEAKQTLKPFGLDRSSSTSDLAETSEDLAKTGMRLDAETTPPGVTKATPIDLTALGTKAPAFLWQSLSRAQTAPPGSSSSSRPSDGDGKLYEHTANTDDASTRLERLHPSVQAPQSTSESNPGSVGASASDESLSPTKEESRPGGQKKLVALKKPRKYAATDTSSNPARPVRHRGRPAAKLNQEHKSLWKVMDGAESKAPSSIREVTDASTNGTDTQPESSPDSLSSHTPLQLEIIQPSSLEVTRLEIPQPSVPGLAYDLDRVLFNPGVYQLQDPHSRVFNFDPYLQKVMPVADFDYDALKKYKTSSEDVALTSLALEHSKRYIGSTSSMTSTLAHFHYLISDFRPLNLNMLSRGFPDKLDTMTQINRAPNAIFLRWKDGTYAIDADKEFDSGNVLMMLGKSMEKLLTMPTSEYERYRKSDIRGVSEQDRNDPEVYEYTAMGDFLMRSQLDAFDSRLPGNGMFDIKTRAVLPIRMESEDFQPMTGYEIQQLQGRYFSYEREYYDMMRSTMLKYMLQARMGRMDGIFVAYHNVERIFGFQYLTISELDRALHGQTDRCLGDQEFKTSLELMNKILDKATAKFPERSIRFHFETKSEAIMTGSPTTIMWVFGEPMEDTEIDAIQSKNKAKIADFERTMMGIEGENETAEGSAAEGDDASEINNHAATDTETASSAAETTESSPPESSTDYATSSSPADPQFISTIARSNFQDRKPLFVASLVCKSRLNGGAITRPEQLKPSDSWEIEYLLQEWDANDGMWARYEQTKAERRDIMQRGKEDEPVEGEESREQKNKKAFTMFLKGMSDKGRDFRSAMDELEEGREKVVWGWSGSRSAEAEQKE